MHKQNQGFPIILVQEPQANIQLMDSQEAWMKNFNQSMKQLISLQFQLNLQLMINSSTIAGIIHHNNELNQKNNSSQGSTTQGTNEFPLTSLSQKKRFKTQKIREGLKKQIFNSKKRKQDSASDYEPSEDLQAQKQYKLSESKNIAKCNGRLIINFIIKSKDQFQQLFKEQKVDPELFIDFLMKFRESINTISDLRFLWVQSILNPFSRILRILSAYYLKRHALSHIFNSRIQYFEKHIKYRQKILRGVSQPKQFTNLKDF